jgi:pimeloyl-ACP methyl ester carboxylesterase
MLQFHDWTTHDAFRSLDRSVDYREGIRRLDLPLLVMAGSQDRLAPPAAAKAQLELAASKDKTLVVFGKENGDREDYGHGDLVFGRGAPEEVYPYILRWLEGRATASVVPAPHANAG